MPKDNENVPLPDWTTEDTLEFSPAAFAPDQMVRCEACLRANPPTRVNCLYCAAVLPLSETTLTLQKPALRPLEKWERGYNNILLPPAANVNDASLAEASELLRLRAEDLTRILTSVVPLPLARAATIDEAKLVERRLEKLGIDSRIMPDPESPDETIKVRSLGIDDTGVYAYQTPETPAIHILWYQFVLLVAGRLFSKRVELKEQKARTENRILSNSEFVTDETVVDLYTLEGPSPYRIAANSFDFSCLGPAKGLLATENLFRLLQLLRERAAQADYDDSFNSVRKELELVWPSEQQNASSGWRRERPGKYSLGSVIELNNEIQFLRYSQLRRYLLTRAGTGAEGS